MSQQIIPSHVALLVPSVRKAAEYLKRFNFQIGPEEEWEGEGTREIYVEGEKANSLLLMEAAKPGAYQRAMAKRGPGLHHLAIDVLNLENFLESLAGSGWLLHLMSVKTMKQSRTAYLARPGFPALIEVQERKELKPRDLFVSQITLNLGSAPNGLLEAIGLGSLVHPGDSTVLNLKGKVIRLEDLL